MDTPQYRRGEPLDKPPVVSGNTQEAPKLRCTSDPREALDILYLVHLDVQPFLDHVPQQNHAALCARALGDLQLHRMGYYAFQDDWQVVHVPLDRLRIHKDVTQVKGGEIQPLQHLVHHPLKSWRHVNEPKWHEEELIGPIYC